MKKKQKKRKYRRLTKKEQKALRSHYFLFGENISYYVKKYLTSYFVIDKYLQNFLNERKKNLFK